MTDSSDRKNEGARSGGRPRSRGRDPRGTGSERTRLSRWLLPDSDPNTLVAAAPTAPIPQLAKRFWPYARPHKLWLGFSLALVALVPIVQVLEISLFERLIDDVLVPGDFTPFWWIASAYVGFNLLGAVLNYFDDYTAAVVTQRFLIGLRTDLFRKLLHLPPSFHDRQRLGDVLSRVTSDASSVEGFIQAGLIEGVSAVVRIVVFVGALLYYDWQLALASLVIAPISGLLARWFASVVKDASREKRRRSGALNSIAEEGLGLSTLVQTTNTQDHEVKRFREEHERVMAADIASTRVGSLFGPLVDLTELAGGLVVIGLGVFALTEGRLTIGELLVFLTFLTRLYSPLGALTDLSQATFSAAASGERIFEFIDAEPPVKEAPGAWPLRRSRGHVEFDKVTFTYPGSDTPALRDVSVTVRPGEVVALVGGSGAGKSTLARMLLRFVDPDEGTVKLDGHDLRELTIASVRSNVGLLLQEAAVFDTTVRENITYGLPHASQARVEDAARAADAHDFITVLPDAYETRVGQRGRLLSGGQRQRVAIARSLLRDTPVLVLDEPTTGLDNESADRILGPLGKLMADRTTIVIAHDLVLASRADRVVVLDEGRVVEVGTHAELLAAGGRYTELAARATFDAAAAGSEPDEAIAPGLEVT